MPPDHPRASRLWRLQIFFQPLNSSRFQLLRRSDPLPLLNWSRFLRYPPPPTHTHTKNPGYGPARNVVEIMDDANFPNYCYSWFSRNTLTRDVNDIIHLLNEVTSRSELGRSIAAAVQLPSMSIHDQCGHADYFVLRIYKNVIGIFFYARLIRNFAGQKVTFRSDFRVNSWSAPF